ncbi:SDR family oxidoreductase [Nocardioides sp.]|uniref:SDR family oxidoreductase n=1 Tax=Nocardioides sp. TaxID=35761 RepID=UPI0037841466
MSARDLMGGKTVLVTGGTGGIGLATATGLAGLGARVGIVGRSATRGAAAADAVRSKVPSAQVDVFEADLSAQAEVRRLAAEVKATYSRLDVLVNNVGGYWAHRHVTVDGLEHTFALNHLAPFLLTRELHDLLVASAPARAVTVSSGAQAMGRIDLDDLQGERSYNGQRAYNQSKLANVLFTYELARRLEGTGVTANVLHPGVVRTSFGHEDSGRWMRLMLPLVRPFMKTPDQGAATPIYLASSPDVDGVSGAYFANQQAKKSSNASYDRHLAHRLWEVSSTLVGIQHDNNSQLDAKDQT